MNLLSSSRQATSNSRTAQRQPQEPSTFRSTSASWVTPKAVVAGSKIIPNENGLIARSAITAGETIVVMGGHIVDIDTHNRIGDFAERYGMDISPEFSFCPRNERELETMPQCFINHSCEPNAGFLDQLRIGAIRDIEPGEEIAYDYAFVLYGNPRNNYEFKIDCFCQSDSCRGVVTVNDWKIDHLQKKYGPWFQPFLRAQFEREQALSRPTPSSAYH